MCDVYGRTPVAEHVTRYETVGHYFYVLAEGNAVNFLHGAAWERSSSSYKAEILPAVARLTTGHIEPGYHEVPDADRRIIADTWLAHFNHTGVHQ